MNPIDKSPEEISFSLKKGPVWTEFCLKGDWYPGTLNAVDSRIFSEVHPQIISLDYSKTLRDSDRNVRDDASTILENLDSLTFVRTDDETFIKKFAISQGKLEPEYVIRLIFGRVKKEYRTTCEDGGTSLYFRVKE
jgi:hypothetical protein